MNSQYDIAVVGAGPVGSMAAHAAAEGGRQVCLLERKETIGTPVRCGEGIGLKGLRASADLDKKWILATVRKVCFVSPAGRSVVLEDLAESYILDRTIMDNDLAQRAVSAGATLLRGTPVVSVSRDGDGVYHCVTPKGNVTAPCIILADGVESRLARRLGWDTALALDDLESCAFCHVRHESIEEDTARFYVGSQYAAGGFLWVFPRGKGLANVGLGILGAQSEPGKARGQLVACIERIFPGASTDNLHCGGVPVGKWLKPLVRGGAMLAGDAARQVNCLSGAGLGYGMLAGRLAGETAARAFENGTCNCNVLKWYEREWARGIGKQQLRSYALKSMLFAESNDAFLEKIAESFEKADPKRLNYARIFLRTFIRHPLMMLKVVRLFA